MLNPFIELLLSILNLYNLVLIAWVIISMLINFEIVNRFNPVIQKIHYTLTQLVEPALNPIRRLLGRILPNLGGIDISPIGLFLAIQFIQSALVHWFYSSPVSAVTTVVP